MKSCVSDLGTRETVLLGRPLDLSETRGHGRGEGDGDGVTVMATVTVTVHPKGQRVPQRVRLDILRAASFRELL